MKSEGISYLRGMCISFTMYPTKPMIKTACQGVSIWGRTSRDRVWYGNSKGESFGVVAVLVRHGTADSRDDIERFTGLLTADANCLRDLHSCVSLLPDACNAEESIP